jgi:hypothetical protein
MESADRSWARGKVQDAIDKILGAWEGESPT